MGVLSETQAFLAEPCVSREAHAVEDRAVLLIRQSLLVWFEERLAALCAPLGQLSAGSSQRTSVVEGVDAVLLCLIEAVETDDDDLWSYVRRLTEERGEPMRKVRAAAPLSTRKGLVRERDDAVRSERTHEDVFRVLVQYLPPGEHVFACARADRNRLGAEVAPAVCAPHELARPRARRLAGGRCGVVADKSDAPPGRAVGTRAVDGVAVKQAHLPPCEHHVHGAAFVDLADPRHLPIRVAHEAERPDLALRPGNDAQAAVLRRRVADGDEGEHEPGSTRIRAAS